MANIGLSKPYYAIYTASGTTVTYSNGAVMAKAVSVAIDAESETSNIFYADNAAAESANEFTGGTLTLTVDDLPISVLAVLLGQTVQTSSSPAGTYVRFATGVAAPYVGFGIVRKKVRSGTAVWQAIILHKVQFSIPADSQETQGGTVSFSGDEITATILRDDTTDAKWKSVGEFTTEANAAAWIESELSIT